MQSTPSSGSAMLKLARRLAVIVVLALAVSGATYAVSVSPFVPATTTMRRTPATVTSARPGAPATAADAASQPAVTQDAATQARAPQGRPSGGGGRGPNLSRGLPELGMHAGVIGVIVLLGASVQLLLRRYRRSQRQRAPIFVHQMAGGSIRS
ncbi:MAG: hypothetical protein AB7K36_18565 [Chloroflexota bacterium]